MKGFIKITPRSYCPGNFIDIEGSWSISNPEHVNINSIVKFGENYIYTSNHHEAYPVLTVETQEEIKTLIIEAQ